MTRDVGGSFFMLAGAALVAASVMSTPGVCVLWIPGGVLFAYGLHVRQTRRQRAARRRQQARRGYIA